MQELSSYSEANVSELLENLLFPRSRSVVVMDSTVQYSTVLYSTVQYYIILYYNLITMKKCVMKFYFVIILE